MQLFSWQKTLPPPLQVAKQGKIIKEGKDVTLARALEIAWLEVSTQRHINRM